MSTCAQAQHNDTSQDLPACLSSDRLHKEVLIKICHPSLKSKLKYSEMALRIYRNLSKCVVNYQKQLWQSQKCSTKGTSEGDSTSEPNPKSKTEKGLPATHKKGPEEGLTFSTDATFEIVLKSSTFVDKTLLIKNIFYPTSEENDKTNKLGVQHPKVMITAPRRFGKSVNLDMFRSFLELEVDQNTGKKITKATNLEKDGVCDTPNYRLFTVNENSEKRHLKIMADDEFVKTHFGKYPIIQVDFLCNETITSKTDAVNVCKDSIHESFKRHSYLYESSESRLNVSERNVCRLWCTPEEDYEHPNCGQLKPQHVSKGLKHLSEYLKKFHGRKVFVLIDEFDSIVSKALGDVTDKDQLRGIIEVVMNIIGSVVKGNDDNLAGVLITGILDLHGTGISSFQRHAFGEDKATLKHYGFNLEEVEKLFEKFSVDTGLRKKAITKYNCYYTERGEHGIFNPYAIVNFLINHRKGDASLKNYWQESGYVHYLDNIFKKDNVKEMIQGMLLGDWFAVNFPDQLDLENLTQLYIANRDSRANITLELVSLFLRRQGYISYVHRRGSDPLGVGIPEDLRPIFIRKLVNHLTYHCGLNNVLHEKCKNQLNEVMNDATKDKAKFIKTLKSFTDKLGELIETTSIDPCNEAEIEGLVTSVILAAGYSCGNHDYNQKRKKMVVIAHKDGQRIIIELKYKEGSSSDAQIHPFIRECHNNFRDKQYYNSDIKLRLIMELHFTKKKDSKIKATVQCLRNVEIKRNNYVTTEYIEIGIRSLM